MRGLRQQSSYYMSSSSKYINKEYIPRLLWLPKDWTLKKVHQHVFIHFAHVIDIEPEEASAEYEKMFGDIENLEDIESLDADHANYKMALYAVNPYKNKYYGPSCRVCGKKSCSNCPFPVFYQ